jgi:transcriptional regulator with XRE-family HTH domain
MAAPTIVPGTLHLVPEIDPSMARRPTTGEGFGQRLARLRKARGFNQSELGALIGVSQRMMTYYEREAGRPPAHVLPQLADALKVSLDELLGVRPVRDAEDPPRRSRLWRKLRQIEKLSKRDQQALLRTIDAFLRKAS